MTTNSDPGPRPVISRYLIIILALGATMLQVSRGAWIQATGLAALALGLVIIQFLAPRRPALKPLAWLAFGVTAATMVIVWMRMRA